MATLGPYAVNVICDFMFDEEEARTAAGASPVNWNGLYENIDENLLSLFLEIGWLSRDGDGWAWGPKLAGFAARHTGERFCLASLARAGVIGAVSLAMDFAVLMGLDSRFIVKPSCWQGVLRFMSLVEAYDEIVARFVHYKFAPKDVVLRMLRCSPSYTCGIHIIQQNRVFALKRTRMVDDLLAGRVEYLEICVLNPTSGVFDGRSYKYTKLDIKFWCSCSPLDKVYLTKLGGPFDFATVAFNSVTGLDAPSLRSPTRGGKGKVYVNGADTIAGGVELRFATSLGRNQKGVDVSDCDLACANGAFAIESWARGAPPRHTTAGGLGASAAAFTSDVRAALPRGLPPAPAHLDPMLANVAGALAAFVPAIVLETQALAAERGVEFPTRESESELRARLEREDRPSRAQRLRELRERDERARLERARLERERDEQLELDPAARLQRFLLLDAASRPPPDARKRDEREREQRLKNDRLKRERDVEFERLEREVGRAPGAPSRTSNAACGGEPAPKRLCPAAAAPPPGYVFPENTAELQHIAAMLGADDEKVVASWARYTPSVLAACARVVDDAPLRGRPGPRRRRRPGAGPAAAPGRGRRAAARPPHDVPRPRRPRRPAVPPLGRRRRARGRERAPALAYVGYGREEVDVLRSESGSMGFVIPLSIAGVIVTTMRQGQRSKKEVKRIKKAYKKVQEEEAEYLKVDGEAESDADIMAQLRNRTTTMAEEEAAAEAAASAPPEPEAPPPPVKPKRMTMAEKIKAREAALGQNRTKLG
ncbi:hypothetical protein JL721_10182 [Aureococcus anophagefferens]|nr:hypothetical protein JL721_10182 [Aureococcus anophagefferens]